MKIADPTYPLGRDLDSLAATSSQTAKEMRQQLTEYSARIVQMREIAAIAARELRGPNRVLSSEWTVIGNHLHAAEEAIDNVRQRLFRIE
jgi:hypothetical protein